MTNPESPPSRSEFVDQRLTPHQGPPPRYHHLDLPEGEWKHFRKVGTTRMIRIDGPFQCDTVDGNRVLCHDGWLALDAQGFPYPIAASEQAVSYEPVEDEA